MVAPHRVGVVTGGASGIGLAIVRRLAEESMAVVGVDWDAAACHHAQSDLADYADRSVFVHADVGTPEGAERAIQTAIERFGRIDVLCNNAAIHPIEVIEEHDLQSWRETFRVNVDGTMLCSRAALPHMKRQGSGTIVNMGSVSEILPYAGGGAYAASKAAIALLTKTLALEAGPYGIRVNCIAAGSIMHRGTPVGAPSFIPIGRYGRTDDVASLVSYLVSDAASYLTGAEIALDGGATAGRERRVSTRSSQLQQDDR